jgi:hypothetical protein
MKKEKWIFKSKYLVFYWGWNFDISFETCGYFDNRPRINLDLIFFSLEIIVPFRNKWTDECDSPKWGICYHGQILWIHTGGKGNMDGGSTYKTIYMPWKYEWVRTSAMRKDGHWENETKGNRKEFWKKEWEEVLWREFYPYKYVLKSGVVQERIATVTKKQVEHRWNWFKWLPVTKRVWTSIDISFNDEVGEETGSYKGGVTGCSHELLPNETPLESLRRMEKERKF